MFKTIEEYLVFAKELCKLERLERLQFVRHICKKDLFFLMWFVLGRKDIYNQWLLDRCLEVQAQPDGCLDLWSRGHYKSSIITFGLTIQDILNDPEITIGIFSCTKSIAKQFLKQIKREFEENPLLLLLFPDILYANPERDSPGWNEEGIIVKRKGNPKEGTIEAWGVVEGQPTSKHFDLKVYDDLITLEYVSNSEMITKVTEAWALSLNLGSKRCKDRYIGTRYHFGDTYKTMMDRGSVKERIYPATDDGTFTGTPVLLSQKQLDEKLRDMGSYVFSSQMLQNPIADTSQGFKLGDMRYYEGEKTGVGMNKYILVDPANDKKKKSDFTAVWVIGLGSDENYYILDIVRDKLNLTERGRLVMDLHKKWSKYGRVMNVGYEQYSMQADIQYIETLQAAENYRFGITPLGGRIGKNERIRRLVPLFEQNRMYFPTTLYKTDHQKKTADLVNVFIQEEYLCFPVPLHDDMLDALARIVEEDLGCIFPEIVIKKKDAWAVETSYRGSVWTM